MTSPTNTPAPTTPTPYATAAGQYLRAGWNGPLPLPPRRKANPPDGYTGQDGRWPDDDTIAEWTGTHGDGNIGLRLPQGVIGLDVDAYTGKLGGTTIQQLEALLGPLPPTWRVTSRDDGISGIRLYHVPAGLKWPGQLTAPTGTSHVEVIQTRHRYAVVWPSIHPDTGGTYRWISPSGLDYLGAPNIEDVEVLPDPWVTYLTGGDAEIHRQTAGLTLTAASSWLQDRVDGPTCRETAAALTNAALHLGPGHDTGSRHEAALAAVMRLTHLAGDGHTGTGPALKTVKLLFDAALARGHTRQADDGEWTRMLAGAIDLAAATTPTHRPADPCTDPTLGGLIDPDAPTHQEQTWTHEQANLGHALATAAHSATTAAATGATHQNPAPVAPQTTPTPTTTTTQTQTDSATDRTSWWPADLTPALTGIHVEPPPEFLHRADGQPLFYRGKVNGLLGESESGKSWIAQAACVQALAAGHHVTYLDFEDTLPGIISRLRGLGAPDHQLETLFRYIGPDEALNIQQAADLAEHLTAHQPALIILDGFNAAMSLLALKINDNDDATKFAQKLLRPLSRANHDIGRSPAVVYIDHLPKDKESQSKGGIGAQAKRAMTTGCALKVEVLAPFGRGQTGKLRLTVDKDRPGYVRAAAAGSKTVGVAELVGDVDGTARLTIHTPNDGDAGTDDGRAGAMMKRVSAFLNNTLEPMSATKIAAEMGAQKQAVLAACRTLGTRGYLIVGKGSHGPTYKFAKPYSDLSELVDDTTGVTNSDRNTA